ALPICTQADEQHNREEHQRGCRVQEPAMIRDLATEQGGQEGRPHDRGEPHRAGERQRAGPNGAGLFATAGGLELRLVDRASWSLLAAWLRRAVTIHRVVLSPVIGRFLLRWLAASLAMTTPGTVAVAAFLPAWRRFGTEKCHHHDDTGSVVAKCETVTTACAGSDRFL